MIVQEITNRIKSYSGEDDRRRRQHPLTAASDPVRRWVFPNQARLLRAVLEFFPSTVGRYRVTDVIAKTAAINTDTNHKPSQYEYDKITVHSDSKL